MSTNATDKTDRTKGTDRQGEYSPAPVVLFPIGGCEAEGRLTEGQYQVMLAELREKVRKHWNEPGLQAALALMEIRAARGQKEAIRPGAGVHDQGQAYGMGLLIGLLREVMASEEEAVSSK
jgi:hypothetical protein